MPNDEIMEYVPKYLSQEEKIEGSEKLSATERAQIVEGSIHIAKELTSIARDIVSIYGIRAESERECRRLSHETEQIRTRLKGEIEKLVQNRENAKVNGEVVVQVIIAMTNMIQNLPEAEASNRRAAIDALPGLVKSAVIT